MQVNNYQIRHGSLEYLPVKVSAEKDGAPYDPTADVVQIALPVINVDVVGGDWKDGIWETVNGEYFAKILVGPGGDVTLNKGDYDILIKITDSPEVPIMRAGMLTIT